MVDIIDDEDHPDFIPNSDSLMKRDLRKSGLEPGDINARPMGTSEKASTNTPNSVHGYVIPYFDMHGKPLPHYRVRLHDYHIKADKAIKYKQPKGTSNHLYFPKGFWAAQKDSPFILITEGEKKAALATKLGFPCVGLGGVDSFRNRTISIPKDSELSTEGEVVKIKVPTSGSVDEDPASPFAIGFEAFIDHLLATKKTLIIVYDSDLEYGTKPTVQRAAASLGFEVRYLGVAFDHIRQLILPPSAARGGKIALDDYLASNVGNPVSSLHKLIEACLGKRSAFPRHPNIAEYVSNRLQSPRLSRKELQQVAMAILSDLDSNGLRAYDQTKKEPYFFDYESHRLYRAEIASRPNSPTDTPFMKYLYRRFGVSAGDARVLIWLDAQFNGELPVEEVTPHYVLARPPGNDEIYLQISDGQFAGVSARSDTGTAECPGLEIYDNGDRNTLFEAGAVQATQPTDLVEAYARQAKLSEESGKVPFWWQEVLKEVRLKDKNQAAIITALLYYVSPWLYRWRGTQLPVEMILGEAGSGKSTLCELRLQILTGNPKLRNAPQDLRDWNASIANTGGLHVTDNLQLLDKNLRARLSDEICRIITEPKPTIEMRRLYSNAELLSVPIDVVFTITAIQQPFTASDIIQRSIILELDKAQDVAEGGDIFYDNNWMQRQLAKFGGRAAWQAHHLYVLHRFFKLVKEKWNSRYKAKHRLIHFEQILMLMADVFGIDNTWIPDYLTYNINRSVERADWAFEGITLYTKLAREAGRIGMEIDAGSIAEWAKDAEDYKACEMLINPRKLGRYMADHRTQMHQICGLQYVGKKSNRDTYKVVKLATNLHEQAIRLEKTMAQT